VKSTAKPESKSISVNVNAERLSLGYLALRREADLGLQFNAYLFPDRQVLVKYSTANFLE
jgi:hypothetical protein